MKKFLSLILCLVMAFSLVALASCGDDETPPAASSTPGSTPSSTPGSVDNRPTVDNLGGMNAEQLYQAALNKVAELTNYRMDTVQTITMSAQGQTISFDQTVIAIKDGINEYVKTENEMESSANMEAWYIDEMFYAIMGGTKAKAAISYDTYVEKYMPEGATSEGALMNIPADWFVDVKIYNVDGEYYLEFVVSGEEYLEYMSSTSLAGMIESVDDLENIVYRVFFTEDGELDNIVTEFAMTIQGIPADIVSVTEISNIGTAEITPPANPDSFIDVTDNLQ
ncbi:MAG: hypothetical protein IJX02_09175 [Clostridia bacterium]|nr:hypothetical protein [Clostridia bacterium]